jgi:putative endonuclease
MANFKQLLTVLKRFFHKTEDPLPPRAALGRRGEQAAARFLEGKGYRILERNFRTLRGEIDLIVLRDGTLAFVEVRSQTQPAEIDPVYTITPRKQARVIRAAHAYLNQRGPLPPNTALRFDVITVRFAPDGSQQDLRHIEGAFEAPMRGFS